MFNQWRHEQPVPHWCERKSLLILLQFPHRGPFFFLFWVSQLRGVRSPRGVDTDYQLGCETPRFLTPRTFFSPMQEGVHRVQ